LAATTWPPRPPANPPRPRCARKHREDKPFAVMAADLEQAGRLCEIDAVATGLLTSRRRPIVLLPRRRDAAAAGPAVAHAVAPGNRSLGVMLPYTPLHHLLLANGARFHRQRRG
jgi:hydrogenase maturation protein HypF